LYRQLRRHRDDDASTLASSFHAAVSFHDSLERIRLVNDRLERPLGGDGRELL
jgi:hypothetical protein